MFLRENMRSERGSEEWTMSESQEIMPVAKNDLVGAVAQLFSEGYRIVQIGCNTLENGYELNYSFDKDYRFINMRVTVQPGEDVPSISVIYPSAFLYENEIHDLFGVPIKNISIDYGGTLYRTAIASPFSVENVKLPKAPKKAAAKPAEAPAEAEKQ
jgi:ech hydrogenase subunit D